MVGKIITEMINYFESDPKRVNHFMKVYAFAKAIGMEEKISEREMEILEMVAPLHDIGIKISEKKYNSSAGKFQEIEGPQEAEKILKKLGVEKEKIERIKYLIAHHHTYNNIEGMDYQILVEADFIVNIYEDNESVEAIKKIHKNIFKTKTGKKYIEDMFL